MWFSLHNSYIIAVTHNVTYNRLEVMNMQVDAIIKCLIEHSGMSYRAMSSALGRSTEWARLTAQPGRDPKLSTVAAVADVAGCDVVIMDRETGERVGTVEPPER